jgi:hypothetical protein
MATHFFVSSNKEVSKKMPPLQVCRYRGTLRSSALAGTKKTRGDKATAQTAFRSDPPIPVVLDTLGRGRTAKSRSTPTSTFSIIWLRHW